MKTPLGRVLGLGSAKAGTDDFFMDRVRSVVLTLLTPYVIVVGMFLFGQSRQFVVQALASLWGGPALFVFIAVSILHMRLGMQTIIEDYVHAKMLKLSLILLNWTVCIGLGAIILLSLLLIFFRPTV